MSVSTRYICAAFALGAALAFGGPAVAGEPHGCCRGGAEQSVRTPDVRIAGPRIHVGAPSVHTSVRSHSTRVVRSSRVFNEERGDVFIFGRGSSYCCADQTSSSVVNNLTVYGSELLERATVELAAVRAVCIDADGRPHPASRPSPEEQVAASFDGEIFRCMAGTAMQATVAEAGDGEPDFNDASTITCAAGEALRYGDGELRCAVQEPRRNCNERSLLRRHGPGIKYVRLNRTETYENEIPLESASASLVFDGGVGGICGGC